MLIYCFVFIIISLSAFMIGKNRSFALLGFFLFSIFYVFEARVGGDYAAYKSYYDSMNDISDLTIGGFEIGYNFLALFFHKIGMPFQGFHIFCFVAIDYFFFKAISKIQIELGVATLLALYYLFYPSLEAMREAIALSIFLYSLTYLIGNSKEEKDDKKFIVVNFIALLFHRTAIIAFIFYVFRKSKVIKIAMCGFFVFFADLQPFLLTVLQRFPTLYNKYCYYIYASSISSEKETILSFKLFEYILVFIVLLFICFKNERGFYLLGARQVVAKIKRINQKKNAVEEEEVFNNGVAKLSELENCAFNLVGLGILIQIFISPILNVTYRMLYFCDVGIILFYSIIMQRIKNQGQRLIYILFLVLYIGFRLSRIFPFENELFTYHFMF